MLLLSRSQQQDADNILQTSSLSQSEGKKKNQQNNNNKKKHQPPKLKKEKNGGPKAHSDQPTTHRFISGKLAFQSRLAEASLFSGCKDEDLKARKTGQRQQPAGGWGEGSVSVVLALMLLLLFQMDFKLTSSSREGF